MKTVNLTSSTQRNHDAYCQINANTSVFSRKTQIWQCWHLCIVHINFISKQHEKWTFTSKVIQLVTITNIFPLKCQHRQFSVLREDSNGPIFYLRMSFHLPVVCTRVYSYIQRHPSCLCTCVNSLQFQARTRQCLKCGQCTLLQFIQFKTDMFALQNVWGVHYEIEV